MPAEHEPGFSGGVQLERLRPQGWRADLDCHPGHNLGADALGVCPG